MYRWHAFYSAQHGLSHEKLSEKAQENWFERWWVFRGDNEGMMRWWDQETKRGGNEERVIICVSTNWRGDEEETTRGWDAWDEETKRMSTKRQRDDPEKIPFSFGHGVLEVLSRDDETERIGTIPLPPSFSSPSLSSPLRSHSNPPFLPPSFPNACDYAFQMQHRQHASFQDREGSRRDKKDDTGWVWLGKVSRWISRE